MSRWRLVSTERSAAPRGRADYCDAPADDHCGEGRCQGRRRGRRRVRRQGRRLAAAGDAARDAARDALQPTTATLQRSALDLVDRMLAETASATPAPEDEWHERP